MEKIRNFINAELKRGVNQTELANKIGLSQSTIQKILNTNTKHTFGTVKLIAAYFRKPVSFFLETDQPNDPAESIVPAGEDKDREELYRQIDQILHSKDQDLIRSLQTSVRGLLVGGAERRSEVDLRKIIREELELFVKRQRRPVRLPRDGKAKKAAM